MNLFVESSCSTGKMFLVARIQVVISATGNWIALLLIPIEQQLKLYSNKKNSYKRKCHTISDSVEEMQLSGKGNEVEECLDEANSNASNILINKMDAGYLSRG